MRYIIILLLFISCNSQRDITGICAEKFIIKDSIVFVNRYDTIFEKGIHDTLVFWDNKYFFDTISINKIKHINKYVDKIIYRENTAKIEALNISYNKLNAKNKEQEIEIIKMKEKIKFYNNLRNIIIACIMLLLVLYISLKINKK